MSETSPAFEFVCARLEAATTLSRIEARGTVRLALREVGMAPATVSVADMRRVTVKVLPTMLTSRAVRDAHVICGAIERALATEQLGDAPAAADPAEIFARMAGDRRRPR